MAKKRASSVTSAAGFLADFRARSVGTFYLTWERWEHALGHPGMHDGLLEQVLEALRKSRRKSE